MKRGSFNMMNISIQTKPFLWAKENIDTPSCPIAMPERSPAVVV